MINDRKINSISPNRVDPWTNSTNIVGFAYAAAPFGIRAISKLGLGWIKLGIEVLKILARFHFWPSAWKLSEIFQSSLGVCFEPDRDLKTLVLIELLGIGLEKFQTFPEFAWRFKSGRDSLVEF